MVQYENASWQEVSRQMVVYNIEMGDVYKAYVDCLTWYRDLFAAEKK
jgi:EAL and modified HD-GYP domain-containing signal transduction protein